jgi:hypothetical protein
VALTAWPAVTSAQQNLFNVPSVAVTDPGGLFFQQQTNLNALIQTNTTLSYGLGRGWEVGLNVFDVPLYNPGLRNGRLVSRELQEPEVLVNGLRVFELTDRLRVGVGTQLGQTAPVFESRLRLSNFTYVNAAAKLPNDWVEVYGGAFYANRTYGGAGDRVGGLLGADIPVAEKKLHLMADWVVARNDLGVAVVGGVLYLPRNWQLSLGAQLPSPGSRNRYGAVLELTYVPGGSD